MLLDTKGLIAKLDASDKETVTKQLNAGKFAQWKVPTVKKWLSEQKEEKKAKKPAKTTTKKAAK